jgi:hypothetical protein|eukprot:COSAG06_NODE_11940_length_1444_cov_2.423048_2_plen_66_part_00
MRSRQQLSLPMLHRLNAAVACRFARPRITISATVALRRVLVLLVLLLVLLVLLVRSPDRRGDAEH